MKRLIDERAKQEMINYMISKASIEKMTILHIREITEEVIKHLEKNAILHEETSLVLGKKERQ